MSDFELTQAKIDAAFADVVLEGTKEDIAFYAEFVQNPNVPDKYGRAPVWTALEGDEAYEKMKIVLSLNPDTNITNIEGQTPVMNAWEKRKVGVGILLMKYPQTDKTVVDSYGRNLMHYAVMSRSAKAVRVAGAARIPLMQMDKSKKTPPEYAIRNKDLDVFEALCGAGLKPNKEDPDYQGVVQAAMEQSVRDRTPMWMQAACFGVFPEKMHERVYTTGKKLLMTRFMKLSVNKQHRVNKMLGLIFGMEKGQYVLKQKEPVIPVSRLLQQTLLYQIRYGMADDVAILLELGADPNVRDKMGRTALYLATEYQSHNEKKLTPQEESEQAYKKAELLLKAGADPNMPNMVIVKGQEIPDDTPFICSLVKKRIGISALLRKYGAELTTDRYGDGAVKIAAVYSKPEAIDLLAKTGADLMQRDRNGKTPLECAIEENKPYNVAMLRSHLIERDETKELFDPKSPMGQRLYRKAVRHGDVMIEALRGTLPQPARPKVRTPENNAQTLAEKVAALSETKREWLYNLAGVTYPFREDQMETDEPKGGYTDRAEGRHTLKRNIQAFWKRKRRNYD